MFRDRQDAGKKLAAALGRLKGQDCVVLALPRGGVPVAAEMADALDAPLDLLLVRKIGAPRPSRAGDWGGHRWGCTPRPAGRGMIRRRAPATGHFEAICAPRAGGDRAPAEILSGYAQAGALAGASPSGRRWAGHGQHDARGAGGRASAPTRKAGDGGSGRAEERIGSDFSARRTRLSAWKRRNRSARWAISIGTSRQTEDDEVISSGAVWRTAGRHVRRQDAREM